MLVELGLVEQRYKAVCEVLDRATVVDVAAQRGGPQTVHVQTFVESSRASFTESGTPIPCEVLVR